VKTALLVLILATRTANSYVPTVEGLFRHGGNPEVATNALVVTAKVTPYNPYDDNADSAARAALWVKWVYNVSGQGKIKLTQTLHRAAATSDADMVDKVYVPDLNPQSFGAAQAERGLWLGMFNSVLINDGSFLVLFLRHLGAEVRLNHELLNQEKVQLLHRYRAWLAQNKGGRQAGSDSPMSPTAPAERERVQHLLASPMYQDTKQVALSRYQGAPAWQVRAEPFEAWIEDQNRDVRQLLLRLPAGEIEIQCRGAGLIDGVHRVPREIFWRGLQEQHFRIEVLSLKTFSESPTETLVRLRRLDQALGRRSEKVERPAFLL
jgi:hypothetical protein